MAASGGGGYNPARENLKQLRSFQELFKGRFDEEETEFLMEIFDWNSKAALEFVLTTSPEDVRKRIEDKKSSWVKVEKKESEKLAKKVENIKKSPSIVSEARRGRIDTSARLFACGPCDHYWWRRTPQRKEVSKCNRCGVRYDPVPRDKEWGWGLFQCERCQNEFGGFCGMWMTSPCFKCGNKVQPFCIRPPDRSSNRQRRTKNTHRCNAPDCNCHGASAGAAAAAATGEVGRGHRRLPPAFAVTGGDLKNTDPGSEADYDYSEAEVVKDLPVTCVHPSTRQSQHLSVVIHPSNPHDSTGSTVATFLSQGDLYQAYETVLDPINEDD